MSFKAKRGCKILITFGPAIADPEKLRQLIRRGVNGFRFNFSHGNIENHRPWLDKIRKISEEEGKVVACMADLQGPKIRLGELDEEPVLLQDNQEVLLYPANSEAPKSSQPVLPVSYDSLLQEIEVGEEVYINDGLVQLEISAKEDNFLRAQVITGGELSSRKGVNLPGSDLKIPAMTDQDREDLEEIIRSDFDMVALSFVRRPRDLCPVRKLLHKSDRPVDLIAKIECRQALENLDAIIKEVEGVIVARGDLGVEITQQRVPYYQKQIIQRANRRGRIAITATQMLESMIHNQRPTRAETSDVANAVIDGSDVVMLSGETAIGNYPLRAAEAMIEIIRATEQDFSPARDELDIDAAGEEKKSAVSICNAAADCVNDLGVRALVVPTFSGFTARLASNLNVDSLIIAFCPSITTLQKTALYRNVQPCVLEMMENTDELIEAVSEMVISRGIATSGDRLLLLAGLPLSKPGVTNFLHLIEI
ncbi:MAG: pyruvate kinase [bacterium]